MKEMSETTIHIGVVRWLRENLPSNVVWWHTPNGGTRSLKEAKELKDMGTLPGVPDLTFILPGPRMGFIELKTATGTPSKDQLEFAGRVLDLGCGWAIARSLQEVIRILDGWGVWAD
jgi:hypothetical protein